MQIPRQKMPEQKVEERIRNFREVPLGFTRELAEKEAARCLRCKKPSCIAGCPVDADIPGFIDLISKGDPVAAARKIKQTNGLPAVCGRVCPQEDQCEKVCVLAKRGDPVAIGYLERYAADCEREAGKVEIPPLPEKNGKRVAVVGSGPAGLTVCGDLIKLGYDVTLYEALHLPGGVLVYGIPEFRLPKSIVRAEVAWLESLGVRFVPNAVIGRTLTMDRLLEENDAVFVGTGAGLPYFMKIPGENLVGVYSANEYLTRTNLMGAWRSEGADTPVQRGGRVAVVGGGNVAMDSARTALRLGAEHVYLVYRRSETEMPARIEEVHRAKEEGIDFRILTNPTKIFGDEYGRVRAIECIKMDLGEPDASGRRRPVPVQDSEFVLEVNTVVMAIGNGANPLLPEATPALATNKWGNIVADEATGKTSIDGVYAGGDIVTGAATVILAMGAGRKAARAIHAELSAE
jgi:glutamate synthase (NADPH/NADH) small chain